MEFGKRMEHLNKSIKKSLIDKNTESFIYNPQLIVNQKVKGIKDAVTYNLSKCSRVDIAVSYVVWSGLSLIKDNLLPLKANSRMLLTTEGYVTDPRSLRFLLDLDLSVRVYVPSASNDNAGFHLKSFMFEQDDQRTFLIGSSNISSRAFGVVHEMAVEIDAHYDGYIVGVYSRIFEDLWNHENSQILTKELIEEYEKAYFENRQREEKAFQESFDYNTFQPNYMQRKALQALHECREHCNKGLVIAATGTGKTYLSAFDVRDYKAKKVLFLVHNRLILTTAISTYQKVFPSEKMLELSSSNISMIEKKRFIFTTDKTAFNCLIGELRPDYFDYIIFDEAHKIGKETQYSQIFKYFKPKFLLGMTATPERTDDGDFLFKQFDFSVPYEIRLLDAMNHELVCPFTYYGLNLKEEFFLDKKNLDYVKLVNQMRAEIYDKGHYGEHLKCLVFCSDVREAKIVSKLLNKMDFRSEAVVSGVDEFSRHQIDDMIVDLSSNEAGSVEIICTVNKFNEGIDIPDVNMIIMLRNTVSAIIYLQQLGRGLRRTFDPHKYVTILDFIGNSNNNFTIAQVLTGNTTVDQRKLLRYANSNFNDVSPYINVILEEQAVNNVIKSISNNFNVSGKLKEKFQNELVRFEEIPTLVELYQDKNFSELELLQMLTKNFYDPFEKYYVKKYNIVCGDTFLNDFFSLLSQFIFRAYTREDLWQYAKLLRGEFILSDKLTRILGPKETDNKINTAIFSEYTKNGKGQPIPFIKKNEGLVINPAILNELKEKNAIMLFHEHIDLIECLSQRSSDYQMCTFDLVTKAEFLLNSNSKDCYQNAVGERIDHEKRTVYCPIKVTKKSTEYDNYIVNERTIAYYTQNSKTSESAKEKVKNFVENNYSFKICCIFPHLKYSNICYVNMGPVKIKKVSSVLETVKDGKKKYNHCIEFELEQEIPKELLLYNEVND